MRQQHYGIEKNPTNRREIGHPKNEGEKVTMDTQEKKTTKQVNRNGQQ